jgi:hypothetical protein
MEVTAEQVSADRGTSMASKKKTDSNGSDRTGMVQAKLTDEQITQKGEQLADEVQELDALKERKRSHNRKWNEEIRLHEKTITELADQIESGEAWISAQDQLPGMPRDSLLEKPKPKRDRKGQGKAFAKKAQEAADAAGGE